ncbi:MAG: hypothetical protein ACO4AI_10475 [Prochlorothrix sp.]|nr:hypothetical protein [Prochlorothrix sp.]
MTEANRGWVRSHPEQSQWACIKLADNWVNWNKQRTCLPQAPILVTPATASRLQFWGASPDFATLGRKRSLGSRTIGLFRSTLPQDSKLLAKRNIKR